MKDNFDSLLDSLISSESEDTNTVDTKEVNKPAEDSFFASQLEAIGDIETPVVKRPRRKMVFGPSTDPVPDSGKDKNEPIEEKSPHVVSKSEPEIIVPLVNEKSKNIIVTPDGRTLAEMLPMLRKGARSSDSVIQDIKNLVSSIEIDGKVRADKRYAKHVEEIREKSERDNHLEKMALKFIQKNARYTEQEKRIFRNLGVTPKEFSELMKKDSLSWNDKQMLLAAGRKGDERFFKGKRYSTTIGDLEIIEFLAKFKFANTRILKWLHDEPQSYTASKLRRLRNNGLVTNYQILGMPDLWCLTEAGMAMSGFEFKTLRQKAPKLSTIPPVLGANYIAACLQGNQVNVLNLDDFPAKNKRIAYREHLGDRVQGEELVSELQIRSSLGTEIQPTVSSFYRDKNSSLYTIVSNKAKSMFREWKRNGQGLSPEMELGNEFLWILYPQEDMISEYHVPDLVVSRARGPNGEPRSIAVEVELSEKNRNRGYEKTMLAYKLDRDLYEKVVWVTPNNRIARMLTKAAETVGFTRYDIVPVITKDGTYNDNDIWRI